VLKKLGLVALALTVVAALAACGDDDAGGNLSADEQAYADQLVTELTSDTSPDNLMAGEADARCAAEGVVAAFGLARSQELFGEALDINDLAAIGANMTDTERQTFAATVTGCVDIAAPLATAIAGGSAGAVTEEDAACIAGKIDQGTQQQLLVAQLAGTEPDATAIVGAVTDCVDMQAVMAQTLLDMGLPQAAVDCVMNGLPEGFFDTMVADLVSGGGGGFTDPAFMQLFSTCTGG
jgi:hypothetical protein